MQSGPGTKATLRGGFCRFRGPCNQGEPVTTAAVGKVPPSAKRPQPKGGSRKGIPNKTTRELREMVTQALERAGGVAYLTRVAKTHPAPFLALVGKALPVQLTGEGGGAIKVSIAALTDEQLAEIAQRPGA